MRRTAAFALVAAVALGAAACGSSSDDSADTADTADTSVESSVTTSSTAPSATTTAEVTGPLQLTVADSTLGSIVVDGEGRTLYLFTADTGSESTCDEQCAAAWPPLVGEVTAGAGITGELGTSPRSDGPAQVTLNGHPLYYYSSDVNPGDTSGQGVGGVWFVVDGAGNAVEGETSGVGGY